MRALVSGLLLGASLAGIAYLMLAAASSVAFSSRRGKRDASTLDAADLGDAGATAYTPPITILKPLCGDEPDLFENLSSFCDQDYEDFQVIFGVADADDPAAEIARQVIARYPRCDATLAVDGRSHGSNRKISNVLNAFGQAKHDILVIADSDVRAGRSLLCGIVAALADERVGAASCLYRGRMPSAPHDERGRTAPAAGTILTLGRMFVEEQFVPSVLVARTLAPMDFCLGAVMAVTREALEAIGGFEALADHLADDEYLGRLVRASGREVALCDEIVEITMTDADLVTLWEHELRWARTMHAARPWGFSLSAISYALPLAAAYWLVSGNAVVGASLVGAAAVARLALQRTARAALDAPGNGEPWLIPARDALGLAVWATHFFGRDVRWRGAHMRVDALGRVQRDEASEVRS